MLQTILLVAMILISVALAGVILIQRSEGGALGMGGGPTGFMSARGAGDLLTRVTWILGSIFFILSLALTLLSGRQGASDSVVDRMKIDAIDPSKLNQPAQPAPTSPNAAPPPLSAPTPQVRNPFTGGADATTSPAAPAPTNP